MRRVLARLSLVVMAAGAFALAPTGAAWGQALPEVDVGEQAVLQADGVAVVVPVTVACRNAPTASLSVVVAQRAGRQIARGFGGATVPCGEEARIEVPVIADVRPFRVGVAFAVADLVVCFPERCDFGRDFNELTVVRAPPAR